MRASGTHFEQVPRAVIEKILAQQVPPSEVELVDDEAVNKRAVRKPATNPATRNAKC
jgi:hypothetical protein